jgi:exodeoxyribonuclease V alpha subunit
MNGETGVLVDFDRDRERAILATDDRAHAGGARGSGRIALPVDALATIRPAYAMSVHKSQGSSAPAIVVVLDAAHRLMLTRNLLYTAVTRSERVCVLVTRPEALAIALRTAEGRARHTRLAELVRG